MANRNYANGGKIFAMHARAVRLDCNFTVDATNNKGITSLKGPTISNVYMHTSTTPAAGNPNPASGTIVVQFQDNFNARFSGNFQIIAPSSGSDVKMDNSALTAGVAYSISILGNATAAQWHALGVPAGITPAVGVSFIAASVGAGANTSTSRVQTSAAAGSSVASIELMGNPQLLLAPNPTSNQGYGASMILQCRDYAGAIVAPAAGSNISLEFYLTDGSVIMNSVQGSL